MESESMWAAVPGTGTSTVFSAAVDAHTGAVAACCDSGLAVVSTVDRDPISASTVKTGSDEALRAAWHPDGAILATGNADGSLRLHRPASDAPAATASHDEEVYTCDFMSPSTLLTGWGECVALWDVGGADLRQTASMAFAPVSQSGAAFGGKRNPKGRVYVFGSASAGCVACVALSDGTVRLVDARSLGTDELTLKSHPRAATACTFVYSCAGGSAGSGDGEVALPTVIASTGMDGSLTAWDLRQTAGPLVAATPHEGAAMTCFPVGGVVLTGGLDGALVATQLGAGAPAAGGSAPAAEGSGEDRRVAAFEGPVLSLHCAGDQLAVGVQAPSSHSGAAGEGPAQGHSHGRSHGHAHGRSHAEGAGGAEGVDEHDDEAQSRCTHGVPGAVVASVASLGLLRR